ncbi:hypothetical protein V7S43_007118 [Phytophthora oleae]|uniref:Uncharacterized protein n=1 Tax=Phytophthora oleae TaxID=2107226 RepID=A0ABD3FRC2_9STRA
MLYQLQDSMDWESFSQDKSRHCGTSQAIAKLSEVTGTGQRDMFVILCVDNMQNLKYDMRTKTSGFYFGLGVLSGIVNASRCWVIAICSATVSSPVNNFLTGSSQWIYQVPTATLSRLTIEREHIFAAYEGNELIELLIDDMGGFGRALAILHAVLLKARKPLEFVPVLTDVLVKLRIQYPRIQEQVEGMRKVFLAVIARRRVNEYSRFGNLSLDQVISFGLVRLDLEEYYLTCPYVLYLLLDFNAHSSSGDLWDFETQEEMKPWQSWGIFNCKVRVLKAMAWWKMTAYAGIKFTVELALGLFLTEMCSINHVRTHYPRRRWLHVPQGHSRLLMRK